MEAPPAAAKKGKPTPGVKPPSAWKRIPKLAWGIIAVMACACTCIGGFLTLGIISDRQNQKATQTALALIPSSAFFASKQPTKEIQPTAEIQIPEDLREAWNHLEQGLIFLEKGDQNSANKEFQTALEMMPPERTGVIILAVQKLNSRDQWIMSAQFLQKGLDKNPDDATLRYASAEVLFHVAGMKDAEPLVRWFVDRIPRWAISQAAMGRWVTIFSGSPKDGGPFIQTAMDSARGEEKPVVRAIMGEFKCVTGNTVDGISLLKEVLNDSNTPPWLRVEVERMIEKWQPK
jgi:hypothetical protein